MEVCRYVGLCVQLLKRCFGCNFAKLKLGTDVQCTCTLTLEIRSRIANTFFFFCLLITYPRYYFHTRVSQKHVQGNPISLSILRAYTLYCNRIRYFHYLPLIGNAKTGCRCPDKTHKRVLYNFSYFISKNHFFELHFVLHQVGRVQLSIDFPKLHEIECSLVNSDMQEKCSLYRPFLSLKKGGLMLVHSLQCKVKAQKKFIPLVKFTWTEPVIWNRSPVLTQQKATGVRKTNKQKSSYLLCQRFVTIYGYLLKILAVTWARLP